VRLLLHVAGWSLLMAVAQLGLSEYQQSHWCDLPEWAGPGIYEINTPRPTPRSEVDDATVTVVALRQMPIGHRLGTDAGTQNSGRRGCG